MNNLARVAILALGAAAAKKYMNQQRSPYSTSGPTMGADSELLDASGQPVHRDPSGQPSPFQALKSNPNVSWIADPQLRARNMQRVKDLWAQRHQL